MLPAAGLCVLSRDGRADIQVVAFAVAGCSMLVPCPVIQCVSTGALAPLSTTPPQPYTSFFKNLNVLC